MHAVGLREGEIGRAVRSALQCRYIERWSLDLVEYGERMPQSLRDNLVRMFLGCRMSGCIRWCVRSKSYVCGGGNYKMDVG
jgi:hypothetical protein